MLPATLVQLNGMHAPGGRSESGASDFRADGRATGDLRADETAVDDLCIDEGNPGDLGAVDRAASPWGRVDRGADEFRVDGRAAAAFVQTKLLPAIFVLTP